MPRARAVTPRCGPAVSSLPRLAVEPGSRSRRSGFSAPPYRDPARLPRIRSTVGDQPSRLDQRPAIRRRHHRGPRWAFRPPLAVAPLREVNDDRPRPDLSPSCRWAMPSLSGLAAFPRTHRRDASNPLLQPTFRVTSTRSKNTLSGDFPPSAVGKPAGVRLRDPPGLGAGPLLGKTPDHLAVIQPPAALCLTALSRLRAERLRAALTSAARRKRRSSPSYLHASPLVPSDTSWANERGACERFSSTRRARFPGRHVNAARFLEPEVPSAVEVQGEHPRGHPLWSPAPVGRRAQVLHVFIDGLRPRLDPSPRRSRGRFMAACASNDFCRSMFQRARRWTARTSRTAETVARMAAFSTDRCLSIDGDRRRCSGSGAEDHRASTFPLGIAPERDFAPTPIASDTSCRGHCRPPCLESTRVTGEAACAEGASKAHAAGGRCGARFPRRNPASSRPRCLPSQGRSRT